MSTVPQDQPGAGDRTAGKDAQRAGDGRQETSLERLDRNFEELMGELRVVVTGVQVLFAFLLIVPFDTGFAHVGGYERTVYFVTLIAAALAAVCVIAPAAWHRLLFRHYDKRRLVFDSNRIVIAGLGFLALAMCGCVLLVASKLFGAPAGALTTALLAVPFLLLWFALPLRRLWELSTDRPPASPPRQPEPTPREGSPAAR
jgi:Family of unknown function (DUF6328)